MKKVNSKTKQTDGLRKQAAKRSCKPVGRINEISEPELKKLIHELHVHQTELEMQNEALQKSQSETAHEHRKYTDLYDFAPVGYFILDRKGRIIEANVTGASLLGFEKRSLTGEPFQRFINPGDFGIFNSHLQKTMTMQSKQKCKLRIVNRDAGSFDAQIDTIAVPDEEGKFDHYRTSVTDVTEILRAEELQESEIKYRGLYETTLEGILMTDMEGHILECNHAYLHMMDYTEKEIKALTYRQMTPAKWHSMERDIVINKILKTGYSNIYEKEYIRKDGTIFPVSIRVWSIQDEAGNISRLWGIVSDITERKQAEEALRNSERLYRAIGESINYGVWVCDPDGQNIYASESFLKLVDLTQEQCSKFGWGEVLHPDDAERTIAAWKECVRTEGIWDIEHRYRGADGKWYSILARGVPVRNEQGEVIYWAGINLDINNLKRAEMALRERTKQLESANKELESFSYSVSHDLRAPLRAIDGYARMILKKEWGKFDEDTTRKFNAIRSNAQMMGQLIDDLLSFSRLSKKQMSVSKLDMESIIMDVWKELQIINNGRNMTLTIHSMPLGYGDRTLIKQVCSNLLANAVKFTKNQDAARIEAGGSTENDGSIYYVKDNGVGFDMAYYEKLFGIFQRLHSVDDFEGTGVGLATVHRIIHRHGGRVWAEGKQNEGATFYFSLPSSHTAIDGETLL